MVRIASWLFLSVVTFFQCTGTWSEVGPDLKILGGRSANFSAFICAPKPYLEHALPILFTLAVGWWLILECVRTQRFIFGRALLVLASTFILVLHQAIPFAQVALGLWWQFGDIKARLLNACLVWC